MSSIACDREEFEMLGKQLARRVYYFDCKDVFNIKIIQELFDKIDHDYMAIPSDFIYDAIICFKTFSGKNNFINKYGELYASLNKSVRRLIYMINDNTILSFYQPLSCELKPEKNGKLYAEFKIQFVIRKHQHIYGLSNALVHTTISNESN